MTSLASREMTEQEMVNTCTAPQMAHLIQVLRQTIRNKDKEIERWVDMVSELQRDGKLDPPEPQPTEETAAPAKCYANRGKEMKHIMDNVTATGWVAKFKDSSLRAPGRPVYQWHEIVGRIENDERHGGKTTFGVAGFPHMAYDIDGKPLHFGGTICIVAVAREVEEEPVKKAQGGAE